jgi:aminopeptidase N
MKNLQSSLLLIFLCALLSASAQKPDVLLQHYDNELKNFKEFIIKNASAKGDTSIDIKFYHLDIEIGIASPYIQGNVTCVIEPNVNELNTFRLDLNSSLTVDSISQPCESFEHNGNQIYIYLSQNFNQGELLQITVWYHGVPVLAGGYKGLRYETHDENEPIIATLSTPYLAHYWYPCKDGPEDKADSVYINITIPDTVINGIPLIAVSNGILENIEINGAKKTFMWRHRYPVVTYYVMAAISNYVHFQDIYSGSSGSSFPLDYYVFEDDLEVSQEGVADMPEVIDFFSDVFGGYPFSNEKYGMTQLGFYGAIENQTNTIINNMTISWFDVSVHELAHMWYGDMITCSNWHHGWLNEGFATYAEALWAEHIYGFEGYLANMAFNQFFGGGTLYLQNAQDTFNIFQGIIYAKGAYVLHMLRGLTGDDVFFNTISDYSLDPDFMYKNATTEDLQEVFETNSGTDLDFFFDQWVYDEYYPYYYYNYLQQTDNTVFFVIKQIQEIWNQRPVFEMPVPLKFNFANGGDTTIVVWNDTTIQQYTFGLQEAITGVEFDPEGWILKKAEYNPDIPVIMHLANEPAPALIYPNPSNGQFYLSLGQQYNQDCEVSVYDLNGKIISRQIIHDISGSAVTLQGIDPGIYYYQVMIQETTIMTGKILKIN